MPTRLRRTHDPTRVLRALRWGSVIAPIALAAGFGALTWRETTTEAWSRAEDSALLVAEYAQRLVTNQEQLIAAGEEALRRFEPAGKIAEAAHLFLASLHAKSGVGLGTALVSPEGEILVASSAKPAQGAPGERDYLRLASDDAPPALMIDRIRLEPGNIDAMIVARRHEFAPQGVWVSAFEVAAIRGFLQDVAIAPDDAASLSRPDGKLLIRNLALREPVMLPPDSPTVVGARETDRGRAEVKAVIDGVTRLYAWKRVGDLDLVANFGVAKQAVVAEWLRRSAPVAALLAAIGAAAYVATLFAERATRAEAERAALEFDRALLAEAEKTALLRATMMRELNHRVKNSLQMIRSLIRLQKHRPEGPDLDEIAARVLAIASIHDLLYHSTDAFNVDFGVLLKAICRSEALAPPERHVEVRCEAEPLEIDANLATPLALCAVELITNAVKHAFGPLGGVVRVSLTTDGEEAQFVVADDGAGMDDPANRRSGLRVVDALVTQIRGRLETSSGPKGTRHEIVFRPGEPPEQAA